MSGYFIVDHSGLKFKQIVFIFRIVFRLLGRVSGKSPNGTQIPPKCQGHKVGHVPFLAFQNVDTEVAGNRLIIRNRPLIRELPVCPVQDNRSPGLLPSVTE